MEEKVEGGDAQPEVLARRAGSLVGDLEEGGRVVQRVVGGALLEQPPLALGGPRAPSLRLDALLEAGLEDDAHGEDGSAADLGAGLEGGEASAVALDAVEPGQAQVVAFGRAEEYLRDGIN